MYCFVPLVLRVMKQCVFLLILCTRSTNAGSSWSVLGTAGTFGTPTINNECGDNQDNGLGTQGMSLTNSHTWLTTTNTQWLVCFFVCLFALFACLLCLLVCLFVLHFFEQVHWAILLFWPIPPTVIMYMWPEPRNPAMVIIRLRELCNMVVGSIAVKGTFFCIFYFCVCDLQFRVMFIVRSAGTWTNMVGKGTLYGSGPHSDARHLSWDYLTNDLLHSNDGKCCIWLFVYDSVQFI